jgi:S1-C subfamily serine protease
MGATQRHRLVRFADAELAGFKVEGPVISVPLEAGPGALAAAGVIGTLGNSMLRNFVVFLDYRGGRLIVEKGSAFGKPVAQDRSGLQVMQGEGGRIEVMCAAPGTPAERAGFKPGDVIDLVDGRSATELNGLAELRELLRAAPGTRYEFDVRRADTTARLHLTLERLLED